MTKSKWHSRYIGEEGIPNVYVTLKDANGNEIDRVTTDENGNYKFKI